MGTFSIKFYQACYRLWHTIMILIGLSLPLWFWQVSGVAFDSYWSSPSSDGTSETVMYRFGSVGQVCDCEPNSCKLVIF